MQAPADKQERAAIERPVGFRRFRYLIDILVLAAGTLAAENVCERIFAPTDFRSGVLVDLISKVPAFLIAWLLLRLRGESLASIGLKAPRSWTRAFMLGLLVAASVFAAVFVSEKFGYRRNLTAFNALQGNLELTLYQICYVLIGAGFYEEFMFRGFLFQGLAMFLGGTRAAWIAACVNQAALFGWAHAYQNPLGIAITGTIGLIMGVLFLVGGRNLWPLIIGHGLYDASRTILFYFQGTPSP
jgi:membrane protease YdiL (CAAX protease family)